MEIGVQRRYSDPIECSEAIARYLTRNVRAKWRLIEALVKIDHEVDMVTSELIYYPSTSGAKKEWFGIEDGEEDVEFGDCFLQLAKLVGTPERGLFKGCRFTLQPDGHYRTEYEY